MEQLPNFIISEVFGLLPRRDLNILLCINKSFSQIIVNIGAQCTILTDKNPTGDLPKKLNKRVQRLVVMLNANKDFETKDIKEVYPNVKKLTIDMELGLSIEKKLEVITLFPGLKSLKLKFLGSIDIILPCLNILNNLVCLDLNGVSLPSNMWDMLINNLSLNIRDLNLKFVTIPYNIFPKLSSTLPKLKRLLISLFHLVSEKNHQLLNSFDSLEYLLFPEHSYLNEQNRLIFINLFFFPALKWVYADHVVYFIKDENEPLFSITDEPNRVTLGIYLGAASFLNLLQRLEFNGFDSFPTNLVFLLSTFTCLKRLKIRNIEKFDLNDQFFKLRKLGAPILSTLTHLHLELASYHSPSSSPTSEIPPLQFLANFSNLFSLSLDFKGGIVFPLIDPENEVDFYYDEKPKLSKLYHLLVSGDILLDGDDALYLATNLCYLSDTIEILDFLIDYCEPFIPTLKKVLTNIFPKISVNGTKHDTHSLYC